MGISVGRESAHCHMVHLHSESSKILQSVQKMQLRDQQLSYLNESKIDDQIIIEDCSIYFLYGKSLNIDS